MRDDVLASFSEQQEWKANKQRCKTAKSPYYRTLSPNFLLPGLQCLCSKDFLKAMIQILAWFEAEPYNIFLPVVEFSTSVIHMQMTVSYLERFTV